MTSAPFFAPNPLKLDAHKQCHGGSSEWDTMDLTSESVDGPAERSEPVNGGNGSSKIKGKNPMQLRDSRVLIGAHCVIFSTVTLKGLRVHQQHKHSYCDGTQVTGQEARPMSSKILNPNPTAPRASFRKHRPQSLDFNQEASYWEDSKKVHQ